MSFNEASRQPPQMSHSEDGSGGHASRRCQMYLLGWCMLIERVWQLSQVVYAGSEPVAEGEVDLHERYEHDDGQVAHVRDRPVLV